MTTATASPPVIFTRTGVARSINCFRYLISSNVCSGAREVLDGCGVRALLWFLFSLPVGRNRDAVFGGAAHALHFPIIAVARGHPQIRPLHPHFQLVKPVFVEWRALGIEPDEILRAQIADDLVENPIQLRTRHRKEDP